MKHPESNNPIKAIFGEHAVTAGSEIPVDGGDGMTMVAVTGWGAMMLNHAEALTREAKKGAMRDRTGNKPPRPSPSPYAPSGGGTGRARGGVKGNY